MKNWEYKELIAALNESYSNLLIQNEEPNQAVSRVFEDFYFYPEEENRVENLITTMNTVRLRIENLGFAYYQETEFLKKQSKIVSDELLQKELNKEEVKDLKKELSKLFEKLNLIEIKSFD